MNISSIEIQSGETEPILSLPIQDITGNVLQGKTDIKIKIQRMSDNQWFDWDDDTFKDSGDVVQLFQALKELDDVRSKGVYYLNEDAPSQHRQGFNTGAVTNAVVGQDLYELTITQDPLIDATNVPQFGELRVGASVQSISEGISRLLGLNHENAFIDNTSFDAYNQLTSARLRIFDSKSNADLATDGGVETAGLIATYLMETVYSGLNRMTSFRMTMQ